MAKSVTPAREGKAAADESGAPGRPSSEARCCRPGPEAEPSERPPLTLDEPLVLLPGNLLGG